MTDPVSKIKLNRSIQEKGYDFNIYVNDVRQGTIECGGSKTIIVPSGTLKLNLSYEEYFIPKDNVNDWATWYIGKSKDIMLTIRPGELLVYECGFLGFFDSVSAFGFFKAMNGSRAIFIRKH